MYKELIKQIEEAKCISIFRHVRPDGDCAFAQFALKEFIKLNFKDKKVKCVSNCSFDLLNKKEKVDNKFIVNSLAIIVDCSKIDRTDDTRFLLAKKRIIIDHHPGEKPKHADLSFVDTDCSATCELLAKIFYSKDFKKFKLNKKICEYLYCGILTDAYHFSTSNTTPETLYYSALLAKDGNLDIAQLNIDVFNVSLDYFNKVSKFRNLLKIKQGVLYVVVNQKQLDELGMTFSEAKDCVTEFQIIKEAKIWAVFAYDKNTKSYDGSIRSRKKYVINKLCTRYNGGGHKNACGVKKLTLSSIDSFIDECVKITSK